MLNKTVMAVSIQNSIYGEITMDIHDLYPNVILNVDSYKVDHVNQYPKDTAYLVSSIIARKPNKYTSEIVATGHQVVIRKWLTQRITYALIDEAEIEITQQGYEFNRAVWEYIVEHHDGYMPLEIKALPEGTVVPAGTVIVSIVNTDPKCFWLSSYIETFFQRASWKMTTVASNMRSIRQFLLKAAEITGTPAAYVEYAMHNFGDRGADGDDAAIRAAIAHGLSFSGSDCTQVNRNIKFYYNTIKPYTSSVVASEHSVMCSHSNASTRDDLPALDMMLDRLERLLDARDAGNTNILPIVSIVADTYDVYRFTKKYIGELRRDRIIALGKRGGKVVVRPDSGNPLVIPLQIIEMLMDSFGFTLTDTGFKQLPPYIGVIQGDGINQTSIRQIVEKLIDNKFALGNLVFGMGGGLTHGEGRDEFSFAQKATARCTTSGQWVDLFKDPITDPGKRSLRGRVTTYYAKDSNKIFSDRIELMEINHFIIDMLEVVYLNGIIVKEYNYDDARANARVAPLNAD
jgi:nicotinamide phosphoribosyltransferase